MFYTGTVKYYDEIDEEIKDYGFFLDADTYAEAVEKLVKHYGENEMNSFTIEPLSDGGVLEIEGLLAYSTIRDKLQECVIW